MLQDSSVEIGEERNSRKLPLDDAEAKAMLAELTTVLVARGKKVVSRPAGEVGPDDLKGPTGNFRAPMVRKGKTLLVGFNPEALTGLL